MRSASTCWIKSVFIVGLAPPIGLCASGACLAATQRRRLPASSCSHATFIATYGGACRAQRRRLPTWRAWELSPIYGDFTGFPHAILTSGARDLFLSLTMLTHRKLCRASVEAELIYEGMSHAQYNFEPMKAATAGSSRPCLPSSRSFQRGREISQIWRWLVLARRHQKTVRA
jgi:acetyl esterase/lipase